MNLQEVQEIFRGDRFATEMGAEILEAEQGRARCALSIGPGHRNAAGGVMGGPYQDEHRFAGEPDCLPQRGEGGADLCRGGLR